MPCCNILDQSSARAGSFSLLIPPLYPVRGTARTTLPYHPDLQLHLLTLSSTLHYHDVSPMVSKMTMVNLSLIGLTTAALLSLIRVRREITTLRDTLLSRNEELIRRKEENDRLVAELEERSQAWVAQQLEAAKREQDVKHELEAVNSTLTEELETLRKENRRTTDELRDKSTELESTRTFLNPPDTISVTDVISMLHSLNSEISRVAAALSCLFPFRPRSSTAQQGEGVDAEVLMMEEWAHVGEIFGERVTGLLVTMDHRRDTVLVQSMIQAYIGVYVIWLVTSWHLEPLGEENILGDIYDSLRDNEHQLVSGRWRDLTRKHIDRIMPSTSYLSDHFIEAAVNVLVVAGATAGRESIYDAINDQLSTDMTGLLNQVFGIKKAIMQDITSSEMELVSVPEEQPFDETSMETFSGWETGWNLTLSNNHLV